MTSPARLVADIGGTNARFAMVEGDGAPQAALVLPTREFPGIAQAIECYLQRARVHRPAEAAIAIATPVTGDEVRMTNHPWAFSARALKSALGLRRLVVLNDFTALALAVPHLPPAQRRQVGGGEAVEDAPVAVLGAGTGLGVSGLLRAGNACLPVAGEGGHATLAGHDEFESAIIAVLRGRFGHVSAERVLSGDGLVRLHEAIAAVQGRPAEPLTPAETTRRGLAGSDPLCRATLDTFCALLGGFAGNLALTLGARGGVYLGGGIVPQLGAYFERSPFRARFEAKGRFAAYLAPIPCYVILAEHPALAGAARALDAGGVPEVG